MYLTVSLLSLSFLRRIRFFAQKTMCASARVSIQELNRVFVQILLE